jgi:hypothetical protein
MELPAGLVPAAEAPTPTQRAQGRAATFVSLTTGHRLGLTVVMLVALTLALFVANVLELPLLALTLLVTIVAGSVGASLRLGRWRLHRGAALLEEPERHIDAMVALESLAEGPWRVQPVGVDARGWVALQRIEQGDLTGALVQARAIRLRSLRRERRRTPDAGFVGEAVCSVLGHLFPEAGLEVTPSGSFRVDEETVCGRAPRQLETLLATLRLLEAVDRGAPGPVLRAWNELGVEALRRSPVVTTLTWGAAARIVPTLEPGLLQAVHNLDARRRRVVLRRFPHLRERGDATYRTPAPPAVSDELSLRTAPAQLAELTPCAAPSCWLPRVPRWTRAVGWVLVAKAAASIVWLGEPLFVLAALAFTPMLVGSFHHRSTRIAPLRDAGISAPARLRELRHMRSRAGPRRGDVGCLHPFERGELMLIVGLHRAERALAEGDPEEARAQITWWLGGADPSTVHRLHAVAIGASLIRVAALLGMDDVASRLADAFEPSTTWLAAGHRSGHGDAPQALALARSLMHATAGRWSIAARILRQAERQPAVVLDQFERALYGCLVRRLRARGHEVPPRLVGLTTIVQPRWIDVVWPR